jgi:hypothetical protein
MHEILILIDGIVIFDIKYYRIILRKKRKYLRNCLLRLTERPKPQN